MSEELKTVELVRELRNFANEVSGKIIGSAYILAKATEMQALADAFLASIGDSLSPVASAPEAKPELSEDEARKIFVSGYIAGFNHEDQDEAWVECRKLLAAQKVGQNG